MCIAIVAPAGCRIKESHLINSFEGNPDGAGIAYIDDGQVRISKGHMKLQQFVDSYNKLFDKFGRDNAMLAHCRIATAGEVSKDNCHPFKIRGGAMIHNGHLWTTYNTKKSDTREFAEIFHNILDYDSIVKAVNEEDFLQIIGHDKMGFLYDDGRWTVAGHWTEDAETGVLFSNSGYSSGYGHNPLASYNDDWDYDNWWEKVRG